MLRSFVCPENNLIVPYIWIQITPRDSASAQTEICQTVPCFVIKISAIGHAFIETIVWGCIGKRISKDN
jgi:hypothetical protein